MISWNYNNTFAISNKINTKTFTVREVLNDIKNVSIDLMREKFGINSKNKVHVNCVTVIVGLHKAKNIA